MKRTTVSIVFLIALLVGPNAIVPAGARGGRGNELQGTIYVAPTASGEALRILSTAYALRPLRHASALGPIIVGGHGLKIPWVIDRLKAAYEAHHAVGLTNATPADIQRLLDLLGHRGSAGHPEGKTVDLAAFRKAPRPDGQFHFSSLILLPRVSGTTAVGSKKQQVADENDIKALNRIFSATPVLPEPPPPSDNPQQNLLELAESYESHGIRSSDAGQVQVVNTVWAARSFLNSADFYYVLQETDFGTEGETSWSPSAESAIGPPFVQNVTLLQTSPQTTMEATQETSSTSYTIGKSVGWNESQGVNASVSASVTITNSKTTTVPPITITNSADLMTASTLWLYEVNDLPDPNTFADITIFNQWIWEVPFSVYTSSQQTFSFNSNAFLGSNFDNGGPLVVLTSTLPMPFGRTFALQQPVVTGVSPSCVNSGDQFTIQGTGMYPSLVQNVLIGGTGVSLANITTVSDSQIKVVAPDTFLCHGEGCSVAVQTTQGTSNTNFTIAISSLCD